MSEAAWLKVVEIVKQIDVTTAKTFSFKQGVLRLSEALEQYVSTLPDRGEKHVVAVMGPKPVVVKYSELPKKLLEDEEFALRFIAVLKKSVR